MEESSLEYNEDIYRLLFEVTRSGLAKGDMGTLAALNSIKRDLKEGGFTTTDKRYIKAVLFPEYANSGKIPGIYPITSTSFNMESSFDIVANDSGFFAFIFTPEVLSNLIPSVYLFLEGTILNWGLPMNLRADGSLMSDNVYDRFGTVSASENSNFEAFRRISYTPSKRDPGIVFEKGRLVGASVSVIPYGEEGTLQGTLEAGVDYDSTIPTTAFLRGASPTDILGFTLNYLEGTTETVFGGSQRMSTENRKRLSKAKFTVDNSAEAIDIAAARAVLVELQGPGSDVRPPDVKTMAYSLLELATDHKTAYQKALDSLIEAATAMKVVEAGWFERLGNFFGQKPYVAKSYEASKSQMSLSLMVMEAIRFHKQNYPWTNTDDLAEFVGEVIESVNLTFTQDHRVTLAAKLAEMLLVKTAPLRIEESNIERLRSGALHGEYNPNEGCRVTYLPRKEAPWYHINIAAKPHQFDGKDTIGMYVCGNGMKPNQRCKVKFSRVIEAIPQSAYREYLRVDKTQPDPRTLELISYIHTGPSWLLRISPKLVHGVYNKIKSAFGWFDIALKRMQGEGRRPNATTVSGVMSKQLAIQEI